MGTRATWCPPVVLDPGVVVTPWSGGSQEEEGVGGLGPGGGRRWL